MEHAGSELIATAPDAVPPLALPPEPHNALLGSLDGPAAEEAARATARTTPPRENGGNQDIKNLTRGVRIFLPVFVDGGKPSAGDLHFRQGDGEITCCGAIEIGGYLDLRAGLIKDGKQTYGVTGNPVFMPDGPRRAGHRIRRPTLKRQERHALPNGRDGLGRL